MAWTLGKLAELVNGKIKGDESVTVDSVATLVDAVEGQISFLTSKQYKPYLATTQASVVIIASEEECAANLLIVDNPHAAYAKVAQALYPRPVFEPGIHPTATVHDSCSVHESAYIGPNVVIEENVSIDDGVSIGANCFIGKESHIGKDTLIYPLVTIYHETRIGLRCIIHSNVVIGADGFGHAFDNGVWLKIPQVGKAVIGNDVEIGACTTIDRGAIGDTVIGDGVKLDNQIQIAHNVQVGDQSVIAAQSGIAGSTKIGKHFMIGGHVAVSGHLEITDNVVVTGKSTVTKSIKEPGSYSSTIPVEPSNKWRRYVGRFKRLESLSKRVAKCEEILKDKD